MYTITEVMLNTNPTITIFTDLLFNESIINNETSWNNYSSIPQWYNN